MAALLVVLGSSKVFESTKRGKGDSAPGRNNTCDKRR